MPYSVSEIEERLSLCPFCSGRPEVHNEKTLFGKSFRIICSNCLCQSASDKSYERLVKIWNRRNGQKQQRIVPKDDSIAFKMGC